MNDPTDLYDPATNPRPRDRWRKPDNTIRRVTHVEDGRVYFTGGLVPRSLTLSEWRDVVRAWVFLPGGS